MRTPKRVAGSIPERFPAALTDAVMTLLRMRVETAILNAVLSLDGLVDLARLRRAVRLAIDAEPILGCRFAEDRYHASWRRRDDLDELALVEVIDHGQQEAALCRFLGESLDPLCEPLVRFVVFRGETDRIGVKITHAVSDAQSFIRLLGLVAGLYRRLRVEPGFVPAPNLADRLRQKEISRRLSFRQRMQILRRLKRERASTKSAYWLSEPAAANTYRGYAVLQLPAERVRALTYHAIAKRVTITSVMLAGAFRAAKKVFSVRGSGPLEFISTVDMRRFLPNPSRDTFVSNVSGPLVLRLESIAGDDWDSLLQAIHEQLSGVAKDPTAVGGAQAVFYALPLLARLLNSLPFWLLKPRIIDLASQVSASNRPLWGLANLGAISPQAVDLGDVKVNDVYLTGPMFFVPALSMVFSMFEGRLTLSVGTSCSEIDESCVRRLLDEIDLQLPFRDDAPGLTTTYRLDEPAGALQAGASQG